MKTRMFLEEDLDYFAKLIQQRIDMRKTQNVRRNDFIDLLLDSVQENAIEEVEKFVICNSFVLFFVGSDTSSGNYKTVVKKFIENVDFASKTLPKLSKVFWTSKLENDCILYDRE